MAHRRGASFRGRSGISDSQRRKKAWIDMNVNAGLGIDQAGGTLLPNAPAAGEDVAVLAFPSSLNQAFAESTILRIRGSLEIPESTWTSTGVGNITFGFGIAIISEQAAEVLTAIPNPATATGYDWDGWMFLRVGPLKALDSAGTIVDVKSMRKWRSGDSIVFVAGVATNLGGGATGSFNFSLRGLFLLP